MKFLMTFKPDGEPPAGASACRQELPEMARLLGELRAAGTLLASEGLRPSDTGARLSLTGGRLSVTDGPFAEAKELIAGFALVRVGSKAEAVELAGRFLAIAGSGHCDVLEVAEPAAA
jgi:hypothetical protein